MSQRPPHPHSPGPSRRTARKGRLIVPADTYLTFSQYTPPARHESESNLQSHRRSVSNIPRRREAFVQANHRFLVDPSFPAGYEACVALPDAIIPWESVDVVCVDRPLACPICLQDNLRCARVTPCGHVFDYVCILQHFAHLADAHGFAKCPLCSCKIVANDLRCCLFRETDLLEVGLPFGMRLVSREKGSMIPRLHIDSEEGVPSGINAQSPLYSRMAFADEDYLLHLMQMGMNDLHAILKEESALAVFVKEATSEIKTKMNAIKARRSATRRAKFQMATSHSEAQIRSMGVSQREGKDLWYFYQAADTRDVFLHPVNHRCLSVEFSGDFNSAPAKIEGAVLEVERKTMDGRLRKKYRFLEHLPDGCEFAFVELDLTAILSADTLAEKGVELDERRAARRRKEIQTRREDRRLEKKHSESLQEYFSTQAGRIPQRASNPESVDSRDISSFPALPVDIKNSDSRIHDGNETTEEPVSEFSTPGSAWGGAEISSYSSVTSNMGLFPSLAQTTQAFSTPRQANSLPASPQSPSPLQGVWGNGSHPISATRSGTSSGEETRRGKRFHGKTTVLFSNAGTPNRR